MKKTGKNNYNNVRISFPMLTVENAHTVNTIICLEHPEWGFKRFNYEGDNSSVGTGSNSKMLAECEYQNWGISSFKDISQVEERLNEIKEEIKSTLKDNSVESAGKWARLQKERTALNNSIIRNC